MSWRISKRYTSCVPSTFGALTRQFVEVLDGELRLRDLADVAAFFGNVCELGAVQHALLSG